MAHPFSPPPHGGPASLIVSIILFVRSWQKVSALIYSRKRKLISIYFLQILVYVLNQVQNQFWVEQIEFNIFPAPPIYADEQGRNNFFRGGGHKYL